MVTSLGFVETRIHHDRTAAKNGVELQDEPPEEISQLRDGEDVLWCASEARILVVDDEPSICEVIRSALKWPGFSVDTVSQPFRIESQLQAKSYHLVLLDYVIPGLTPETTFEWLRRDQPDASIIVISGYPSVESVVACLRAKTYDYLTKPFELNRLQTVVRRCLEHKGVLRMSEESLRETLGLAIRERRKAQGLTLAKLAERTKVSLGYLSQIELGKNSASIETLYRICLGLGLRMGDLFQSVRT